MIHLLTCLVFAKIVGTKMSKKLTNEFEVIDLGNAYMPQIINSFQKCIEKDSCISKEEFKERYRFIKPVGSQKYKVTIELEAIDE